MLGRHKYVEMNKILLSLFWFYFSDTRSEDSMKYPPYVCPFVRIVSQDQILEII